MIVTAMLAWYDEQPDLLHRAVTSLAVIADRIVAADGRWNYYPGASYSSPPEQYDAIHQAAREAGIHATIDKGQHWTGQVAKRNHLLQITQPTDWLMPLDADWELQGDRDQTRQAFASTQADALTVPFHTPANETARLADVASTNWHANMAGTTVHEPLIWRNLPGIRIENYHWLYSAIKNGHRVALWGQQSYPQAHTEPLDATFQINHHCLHRDERTILANRAYCEQRDQYAAFKGREP